MEKPELSKSIAPIFEKLEKLSKIKRILIFCGILIVIVGVFVYTMLLPKFDKISKLESEYKTLTNKLNTAKRTASSLPEFKEKMNNADMQLKIVMQALPETKEIPTLLESISLCGQDAGLEFILFQPGNEINKNFYAEIPVSIIVTGKYHNVATFFDKVARLPRIVNINDISMKPDDKNKNEEQLLTSCTAITYKFLDAKDSAPAEKVNKKGIKARK
ncbi:MAG: type 4a pilus biogenesis protein PilO [Proteobacteria bacterium]|nr:type 4a pilus biogenesis protein PilO [Pseudomonadota bacterium]MBU4010620.1 type 4a pilus biogenesis protein PilO [Pseudomonadota bacterium]MBU4035729.1 type 4a pilus biogenesis protein PilO [Pseudomonadota bacterium]